jgi:hypothetical protein
MEKNNNPFEVNTPERLSATELVELFVPYPEFENLQGSGHHFLHGHRGSGKSMMLRMMEPQCQLLLRDCALEALPYFGVYLSIKTTEINQPEFQRLEDEPSGFVLSEHVLTTKVLSSIISTVGKLFLTQTDCVNRLDDIDKFISEDFLRRLTLCGWSRTEPSASNLPASATEKFAYMSDVVDELQAGTVRYIKNRSFVSLSIPYNGALLGFQDVLLPIVKALQKRNLIPKCPVFVLVDDADNLTRQQTRILNTWVSYRSTDLLCLKISTQLNYKTYLTSGDAIIEMPHDFSEINFTTVKTGDLRKGYPQLVEDIVKRRLLKYGLIDVTARDYFPEDQKQFDAIKVISDEIKSSWAEKSTGGFRAADDAYRLARPEYIRRLGGSSKQGATYSYAGFDQLVHISSGIIRFFLEPAAKMFADELKSANTGKVARISPAVQNIQIRAQSDELLLGKFENLRREVRSNGPSAIQEVDRLRNLIQGIGSLFQAKLLDENASQRRNFSFHLSDSPSIELLDILELGVRSGYFYKSAIGRKDGMGRTTLYVLTRRLAPAFKLDPMGFSGYLTVTNDYLSGLLVNPNSYLKKLPMVDVSVGSQLQLGLGN